MNKLWDNSCKQIQQTVLNHHSYVHSVATLFQFQHQYCSSLLNFLKTTTSIPSSLLTSRSIYTRVTSNPAISPTSTQLGVKMATPSLSSEELSTVQKEIFDIWFEGLSDDGMTLPQESRMRWFVKNEEFDNLLRTKFEKYVLLARDTNSLDEWKSTPDGVVAYILLSDQFTRNIFRNHPDAFSGDDKARHLSFYAIENGMDNKQPSTIKAGWIYMPLMHAEDATITQRCIDQYGLLSKRDESFKQVQKYAQDHHDVVAKFGRYPHRNKTLNRETTPEEAKFLESNPGW